MGNNSTLKSVDNDLTSYLQKNKKTTFKVKYASIHIINDTVIEIEM